MALNPDLIRFFVDRITGSDTITLKGNTAQLFEHLVTEVKDNPVFNIYEQAIPQWNQWVKEHEDQAGRALSEMPATFEAAKQLAYTLYRGIAQTDDLTDLLFGVTGRDNLDQAVVQFNRMFLPHLIKALEDIANANPEFSETAVKKVKGKTVFIIHGHDTGLISELELLLKIGGVPYIVLHEQADQGRTVIDKLVQDSEASSFAVAVLSPDDLLSTGEYRARQNVILEIGYFMGLLGKDRVRLLVKGDIDIPSDLYGILYEKYEGTGSWKVKLAKELIAAGIFVDLQAVVAQY